jgi:hypothetical protein
MMNTHLLPDECLFRYDPPPRTPVIDGRLTTRMDLASLKEGDEEALVDNLMQRDTQALAYEQLLCASCCFFAQEMIMGPAGEPYMGRFVVSGHHLAWDALIEEHNRILVEAARDHGKSYFWSVVYPIWKGGKRSPGSLIYLFSSNQQLAEERMAETSDQLEKNPKLKFLLPPGNLDRLWNKREIRLSTGTVIRARGWGVRVRGGHPQAIVCDDILTDDHLYSETQRGRATDYFFSVPSNMITPEGQLIVCGTPFHFADVYKKIENTGKYAVSVYPAKSPEGEALFPERYSAAALKEKEEEIGRARFAREFMCKPLTDEASLFPSKLFAGADVRLPYNLGLGYKYWHDRGFLLYAGMDIAMSAESGADYTWIFTIATNQAGERWIANLRRGHGLGYEEQISLLEQEYSLMRFEVAYVEANQAQRLIPEGAIRRTGVPIRKFFTLGVQPKKDWNKGMSTLSAGKHHLDRGVPGLRLSLENKKWRIPVGDASDPEAARHTQRLVELWIGEMQCISYQDGKVVSVGEHDDSVMACWMADCGIRLGGASFSFGDDRETTEADQAAKGDIHGIPAMPRMAGAARGDLLESDILVAADFNGGDLDPEMLESTVKQLPGPPVHLVRRGGQPEILNGCYILRVEGDPGFYRYAIEKQGYGQVVTVEVRAMQAPGTDGSEVEGAESFDPFGLGGYFGEDKDDG